MLDKRNLSFGAKNPGTLPKDLAGRQAAFNDDAAFREAVLWQLNHPQSGAPTQAQAMQTVINQRRIGRCLMGSGIVALTMVAMLASVLRLEFLMVFCLLANFFLIGNFLENTLRSLGRDIDALFKAYPVKSGLLLITVVLGLFYCFQALTPI